MGKCATIGDDGIEREEWGAGFSLFPLFIMEYKLAWYHVSIDQLPVVVQGKYSTIVRIAVRSHRRRSEAGTTDPLHCLPVTR